MKKFKHFHKSCTECANGENEDNILLELEERLSKHRKYSQNFSTFKIMEFFLNYEDRERERWIYQDLIEFCKVGSNKKF